MQYAALTVLSSGPCSNGYWLLTVQRTGPCSFASPFALLTVWPAAPPSALPVHLLHALPGALPRVLAGAFIARHAPHTINPVTPGSC